ncbi:hypothetical protein V4C56_09905 [Paraburkholderia azotifigens]|uniref:Uncharacterized protein n=1 Tax=Paraburkholderia azotifigens TaxID=2057004 RepID=A0ABU9QZK5_9BURK
MTLEARQRDGRHTALLEIAYRVEYAQQVSGGTGETEIRFTALAIQGAFDADIQGLKRSGRGIGLMHFAQHIDARQTRGAADHAERTPSHHRRCIHRPSLAVLLEVLLNARIRAALTCVRPALCIESVIAAPIRI